MKKLLFRSVLFLFLLATVGGVAVYTLLNGSLPQLDGEKDADGLRMSVTIERDAGGIPTITASNRIDLAFATGYVHGQDRFFSMDLMRRKAAGELAEIVGAAALPVDRGSRLHRFRARSKSVLENIDDFQKQVLSAYADGVNQGLNDLDSKPFEYYLLGVEPRAWEMADSLLVVYAMFLELNDETAERDIARGLARNALSPPVYDWLFPDGTEWDAPLMGEPRDSTEIPGPELFSLNGVSAATASNAAILREERMLPGSNNWAVAGHLTNSGAAIVANDMHLGLSTPNIWYRARLRVTGDTAIDLTGVTIPGAPIVVAGSNGRIAWANTNSYGDWTDAVVVRPGEAAGTYLTPDGPRTIVTHTETIRVKDGQAEELNVRETIWGPLRMTNPDPDELIAISWLAHHPESVSLNHLDLEKARSAEAALDIANSIGMPPQNFVVGDVNGAIGWTIAGKIPRRTGSMIPVDWSVREGWDGWIDINEYPRVYNPPSGRIWTANARVADGDALAIVGDSGYDLGARARQIRDGLHAIERFSPTDMLSVHLDDRAIFLERWRDLLLETLDSTVTDDDAQRAQYRQLVEDWTPRAIAGSVGYRFVREFRNEVRRRAILMIFHSVIDEYGQDYLETGNQLEGPLWSLVTQKPPHILTNDYADWDDLLLQAIDSNIEGYLTDYSGGLENRTWGERNTAAIRHPLSRAVPFLSRWLDMPADPLPGDANMPRVQYPAFGASERFAVSPGDEANGYLHMPAGQSGHPLSDFYFSGHDDWVTGRASSFLPGATAHTLTLKAAD
jgi:penicillin amidase